MSRTGIEDATNSVASSGSSTPSSAATEGSLQPLAAKTPKTASAASPSAPRQLASQSESGTAEPSSMSVSAPKAAAGSTANELERTLAGSCQAPSESSATWGVSVRPASQV